MRSVDKVTWYVCWWEVIRVFIGRVDFAASSEQGSGFPARARKQFC